MRLSSDGSGGDSGGGSAGGSGSTGSGGAHGSTTNGLHGIVLVQLDGGTFTMGDNLYSSKTYGSPAHAVTVNSFKMSKTEVTQKQWAAVMGSKPKFTDYSYGAGDNFPAYSVSWYDAIAFCNKLSLKEGLQPVYYVSGVLDWANLVYSQIPLNSSNENWDAATRDDTKNGYRLPTEAEWEYAARAGTTTRWYNGDQESDNGGMDKYAWYEPDYNTAIIIEKSHEVGTKTANAWGLHDMFGNVGEWCFDLIGYYTNTDETQLDPRGPDVVGNNRIIRGGNWKSFFAKYLASACRDEDPSYQRAFLNGLRVVRP